MKIQSAETLREIQVILSYKLKKLYHKPSLHMYNVQIIIK